MWPKAIACIAAQGRNVPEGHYEAAQTMVAPAAFKCTCGRRKAIRRLADSSLPHPQRCTDVCSKNALRCQASSGNSTTLNETIHEVWLAPGAKCAHASSLRNVSLDACRVARALSVCVARTRKTYIRSDCLSIRQSLRPQRRNNYRT